ncbi:MAG: DUF2934 domain-containing protein [Deltaproteobacteria bacterium]|nr:DUF2934 domain-containing protein [Deltaproteobacteria bacterium]
MMINWFTVGAQALNFLVLVWLMKHFLYKPILNAINAREKKIAAELADADKKKADAQKERNEYEHKNEQFDEQRASLLSKAKDEAEAERKRLFDEARQAAEALKVKQQETLKNDANNLNRAITQQAQDEVFAIARKVLMDLAETNLEERMTGVFIRRLREMNDPTKAAFVEAFKKMSDPVLVRSTLDLSADHRATIQKAINETFSADLHLQFETAPELVSGIELTTQGQKVAWSIADYLASLKSGVDELVKEKDKTETTIKPSADLTTKISKRAYELYEEGGRKNSQSAQNWTTAERELRNNASRDEAEPDRKGE